MICCFLLFKEHEEEERRELQKMLSQDKSEKDAKSVPATPKQNSKFFMCEKNDEK